ncbi:hypothetical protein SETIT_4G043600v2 [Setaria italica]|uniref:Uncharacterized protein n=1 Tax=Setaria italica TaxID=4555 RepID=A0A368QR98_SETIT|nr:hypothetical protein SETIT_4G043600v2 [Setaria italica]
MPRGERRSPGSARGAARGRAAIGGPLQGSVGSLLLGASRDYVHVPARCAIVRSSVIAVAGTTIASGNNKRRTSRLSQIRTASSSDASSAWPSTSARCVSSATRGSAVQHAAALRVDRLRMEVFFSSLLFDSLICERCTWPKRAMTPDASLPHARI